MVGLGIDAKELDAAPTGAHDATVCADITRYHGRNDADLVICQSALEHVRDTEKAFAALATIPKVGGRVAIFVPSRNAVFARVVSKHGFQVELEKSYFISSYFPFFAPAMWCGGFGFWLSMPWRGHRRQKPLLWSSGWSSGPPLTWPRTDTASTPIWDEGERQEPPAAVLHEVGLASPPPRSDTAELP